MNSTEDQSKISVSLESIIDNLPSAILVMDRTLTILLANKMAAMLANKAKEEFFGSQPGEAINCVHWRTDPRGCGYSYHCRFCGVRSTVEETIRTRRNFAMVEATLNFEHLGERILSVNTSYIKEHDMVIVAINDITEAKQREKAQLEKQKLKAAIETAGGICHEMNQPLQTAYGLIELMLMECDESDPAHIYLLDLKKQLQELGRITKRLMRLQSYRTMEYVSTGTKILDINKSSEKSGQENTSDE